VEVFYMAVETVSAPEFIEEKVTYVEIGFPSGEVQTFTLRSGESLERIGSELKLDRPSAQEKLTIVLGPGMWYGSRPGVERRPVDPPTPSQVLEAATKPQASTQREDARSLRVR
jgi:hypothetical protein